MVEEDRAGDDVQVAEDEGPKFALEPKLFGKWSYQGC
jgi:hypothetical protein